MGADQAGFGTDLSTLTVYRSGNIRQQVVGGYDVGAGNFLLVNIRTNVQAQPLAAQPDELGFFIFWGKSPRKGNPPVADPPGPAYPGVFDGPADPPVPGTAGRGYMGTLLPNAYPTAPPAGIQSYDWHWPLFRIPVKGEPAVPVIPWSMAPGAPPPHFATDLLFLIPAPMDYARIFLYVRPDPISISGIDTIFQIKAGAVHGCQGFGGLIQRP